MRLMCVVLTSKLKGKHFIITMFQFLRKDQNCFCKFLKEITFALSVKSNNENFYKGLLL